MRFLKHLNFEFLSYCSLQNIILHVSIDSTTAMWNLKLVNRKNSTSQTMSSGAGMIKHFLRWTLFCACHQHVTMKVCFPHLINILDEMCFTIFYCIKRTYNKYISQKPMEMVDSPLTYALRFQCFCEICWG